MGRCVTYAAVRDGDPDRICEALHLARTGEYGAFDSAKFTGVLLPSGWYVVISVRSTRFYTNSVNAALSAGTAVLSSFLEEHVMYSACSFWENGRELWSLAHDCNSGVAHLEQTGAVPAEIAAIAEDRKAKQESGGDAAGVDYIFDIPEAALEHITGLRYELEFEVLRPLRVGWFERLRFLLSRGCL